MRSHGAKNVAKGDGLLHDTTLAKQPRARPTQHAHGSCMQADTREAGGMTTAPSVDDHQASRRFLSGHFRTPMTS